MAQTVQQMKRFEEDYEGGTTSAVTEYPLLTTYQFLTTLFVRFMLSKT